MIAEIAQAATEAAKSSSYITGHFVIDGALLIGALKTVEVIISKVRTKRNGGNIQVKVEKLEQRPKPGDGSTCREHGEALASLVEFKDTTKENIREIKDDIRQIRDAVVK